MPLAGHARTCAASPAPSRQKAPRRPAYNPGETFASEPVPDAEGKPSWKPGVTHVGVEPDGTMLTGRCRSRTSAMTDMPERPITLALADACDGCQRDRASRLALMAIWDGAKPKLADLQPRVNALGGCLGTLLERGADAASAGHWHDATLQAREANDLLAEALRLVYADPGAPEGAVALPSNTYHAMRVLSMTTLALASRALADETPTCEESGHELRCLADSVRYSFAALAQDPELLARGRTIPAETCSHRG